MSGFSCLYLINFYINNFCNIINSIAIQIGNNDMSMINRYKFTKNIYKDYIVLIIKNKKYEVINNGININKFKYNVKASL